jgi:hypothetical protein
VEWIEQLQRDLGAPVLQFAQQNYILLLMVGIVAVVWLVGGSTGNGGLSFGFFFGGDSNDDGDSDGGGDGGGGDGGGGGD